MRSLLIFSTFLTVFGCSTRFNDSIENSSYDSDPRIIADRIEKIQGIALSSFKSGQVTAIDSLFLPERGEFETTAAFESRRLQIRKGQLIYLDLPLEFLSYEADTSFLKVTLPTDTLCTNDSDYIGCMTRDSSIILKDRVKYSQSLGNNAFGAMTKVIDAKGEQYHFLSRNGWSFASKNGGKFVPERSGIQASFILSLKTSARDAQQIKVKKKRVFARIGIRFCGEEKECIVKNYWRSVASFTAPVNASVIKTGYRGDIHSIVVYESRTSPVIEVFSNDSYEL